MHLKAIIKFARQESFTALKPSLLEHLRSLKPSNLAKGIQGPKMLLSGEFLGAKTLQFGEFQGLKRLKSGKFNFGVITLHSVELDQIEMRVDQQVFLVQRVFGKLRDVFCSKMSVYNFTVCPGFYSLTLRTTCLSGIFFG